MDRAGKIWSFELCGENIFYPAATPAAVASSSRQYDLDIIGQTELN